MNRPNIILILCDQLRGDCIGADGKNAVIQTPNIDFLASRGTRFAHAYSAVPSCIPARAILWTGMDQWHTGILGMNDVQGRIRNDYPHTMAGELAKAGYQTQLVGKAHFTPQRASMGFEGLALDEAGRVESSGLPDDYRAWFKREARRDVTPDDHGVDFNSWIGRPWHTEEYLHPTAWTMSRAMQFINGRDTTRPFFLNISFDRPHSPYVPPQAYWDMYIDDETPAPHVGDWAGVNDRPHDAVDPNTHCGKLTARQIHRGRAGYYGDVSFIDAQLGRLMTWLRRYHPKLASNTWFIFTADHGDMLGDHHLWRKSHAYEGSARVPLLVKPPKGAMDPRPVADGVAELRDIMPTVLEIAGVPIPPTVTGRSLLQLMRGETDGWRTYLHGEHLRGYSEAQEMHYVTDGKQKFIWLPLIGVEQFFDVQHDPGELTNLIAHPKWQDRIQTWRQRLADELAARNIGWVKDGKPHRPNREQPISPYRDKRWEGK